jgi:hypothetical protein
MHTKKLVLISCSLIFILSGCNPFKEQNFEDCLLENLKGVKSDDAAADIRMACAIKNSKNSKNISYQTRKCENRELTLDEKKLVNGRAIVEYDWLTVILHNGNSNIKINGVKVKLIDKETTDEFIFDLSHYKVEPLKTSEKMLSKLLYPPKKWDWNVHELTTEVCN